MTLGDILSSSVGVPIVVGKVVEFHVSRLEDGVRNHSRPRRCLSSRLSWSRNRSAPKPRRICAKDRNGPRKRPDLCLKTSHTRRGFSAERQYKFLAFVLRDHEHPIRRFVENDQYEQFKQAIIPQQIGWLSREYFALVEQEYPEIMTKEDVEDLNKEAEGK